MPWYVNLICRLVLVDINICNAYFSFDVVLVGILDKYFYKPFTLQEYELIGYV